jgi:hypothetical protein
MLGPDIIKNDTIRVQNGTIHSLTERQIFDYCAQPAGLQIADLGPHDINLPC